MSTAEGQAPGSITAKAAPAAADRRLDLAVVGILAIAVLVRFYVLWGTPRDQFWDEYATYIRLSESISFEPGHLNLPIRSLNHPALVSYVVKASGALFGKTTVGYRMLHLACSLAGLVLAYAVARHWYGRQAARWTLALLAFNEYGIRAASIATSHAPYFLFCASLVYSTHKLLATRRARYWYAAAVSGALAYYCKEASALLVATLAIGLVIHQGRLVFTRHLFGAMALLAVLAAPDIYWNTVVAQASQVTYADHLSRIGGLGFSFYPLAFYMRRVIEWWRPPGFWPYAGEYDPMNPAIGVVLLTGVAIMTFQRSDRTGIRTVLLTCFWGIFGFFSLFHAGRPTADLDPVGWFWVEITLVPAAVLAGAVLGGGSGRWRRAARWCTGAAMAYAVFAMLRSTPWLYS